MALYSVVADLNGIPAWIGALVPYWMDFFFVLISFNPFLMVCCGPERTLPRSVSLLDRLLLVWT